VAIEKEDMESELAESLVSGKEGEELRARQDLTAEYSASLRRLDTLARLLASHSQCVAVAISNDTLYITANELFKGSRDNNNKVFIGSVIEHYRKLANAETISPDERNEIFKSICSKQRFGKASVPETISTGILNALLVNQVPNLTDFLNLYDINAGAAGLTWGIFIRLYRDFIKFEKSVKKEIGGEESFPKDISILNALLLSLKNKKTQILTEEPKSGVHAEVQMLSFLVKAIESGNIPTDGSIYIGISKLCCMNCRVMLDTANEVFKEKNIKVVLEFRGKHDLDFGKWLPPATFQAGFEQKKGQNEKSIEYQIGFRSKLKIDTLINKSKPSGVSMEASQSGSDTDIFEAELNENRKQELKRQFAFLNSIYKIHGNIELKEALNVISVGLQIQDFAKFVTLQKHPPKIMDVENLLTSFLMIWKEFESLSISKSNLNNTVASASSSSAPTFEFATATLIPDTLLKILQNSAFSGELSKSFATINSDSLKRINAIGNKKITILIEPATSSLSNTMAVMTSTNPVPVASSGTSSLKDVKAKTDIQTTMTTVVHHSATTSPPTFATVSGAYASISSQMIAGERQPFHKKAKTSSFSASGSKSEDDAVIEGYESNNTAKKQDLEVATTIEGHDGFSIAPASPATPVLHSFKHLGKRKAEKVIQVKPSISNDMSNSTTHQPPVPPKSK
jgi:hypothetical protein